MASKDKYYRVKQDTFLWHKGAILKDTEKGSNGGYSPETDIWDTTEHNGNEYISAPIVENNPDWFERVYPVNLLTKIVYKAKAQAREHFEKNHTE